ncbi:hypothetical protein BYT27DRAFT_6605086 [Phlegmacium glaucopus]|nr:hypothetical protein BYT27DRAFT_6605086 [Phlegmacium glaucopus]
MSVLLKRRQSASPTLQPLVFTSEPIIDLANLHDDLPTMIHEQRPHHKLTEASTITFNHLAIPTEDSSHQNRHHAQSDCGHGGHGSPRLKRNHSLLRHFSLRSKDSFTLRKSRHQDRVRLPPPPLVLAEDGHSTNGSLSIWKRWRVKSFNTSGPNINDGISSPMTRSQGLGIVVSRLVALFSSSCPHVHSSWIGDGDWLDVQTQSQGQTEPMVDPTNQGVLDAPSAPLFLLPPLAITPTPSLLPLVNPPTFSKKYRGCEQDDVDSLADSLALLLIDRAGGDVSGIGSEQDAEPDSQLPPILKEQLSCSSVDALGLLVMTESPPSSSSTSTPSQSNPQSSSTSNYTLDLSPNLKPSISQRRRAKFTLGDESELDSDLLGPYVPASVSEAAGGEAGAVSNSGSAPKTTALDIHRPPLTRHERLVGKTRDRNGTTTSTSSTGTGTTTRTSTSNWKSTRRWTLSSALTDEGISDQGLIKELERMRGILERDCTPLDMDGQDTSLFPSPSSNSSPTWLTTQQALLTTRELILTERHYLSSLLLLLCPNTTLTPVPEMMVSYVKELVGVSERLLKGMEREPSVRGVAEVFVEVGGGVGVGGQVDGDKGAEGAFVDWCCVVGGWFQDDLVGAGDTAAIKKSRKKSEGGVGVVGEEHHLISDQEGSSNGLGVTSPSPTSTTSTTTEHVHSSPLMRTVSTWRKSMPSIAGLGEGSVWRKDRDKGREGDHGHGHRGRVFSTISNSFTSGESGSSWTSSSSSKPIRRPSVRDLAILPTQRVMRYVLLYRDLLANTPPSSSTYPIVERAVEVACRIAEKCDRAQGNAAFVAGGSAAAAFGSSSNGSSNSMLNNSRRSSSKRMTLPEPTRLKLKII